ncbi:MAG: hypothetical protein IT190_07315 [Microbacteriaceae bacterium]|nr:hypothetical protein [Microbacteriaceae bacterium]
MGRFTQADSIVPGGVQGLDRYAYVRNNPLRYVDPSGHEPKGAGSCYDSISGVCVGTKIFVEDWKNIISKEFGVTLDDRGAEHPYFTNSSGRAWDARNAQLAYLGLSQMNSALGGKLKSIIGSATFTLNSHPNAGGYFGYTTYPNSSNVVDFYTNSTIPIQNLYHEFGHVLDNSTGDAFTTPLGATVHQSTAGEYWFGGNSAGFLSSGQLFNNANVDDPYYGPLSVSAIQDNNGTANEQWGDIWANYVAGNINQNIPGGAELHNWITTQLTPFIGAP